MSCLVFWFTDSAPLKATKLTVKSHSDLPSWNAKSHFSFNKFSDQVDEWVLHAPDNLLQLCNSRRVIIRSLTENSHKETIKSKEKTSVKCNCIKNIQQILEIPEKDTAGDQSKRNKKTAQKPSHGFKLHTPTPAYDTHFSAYSQHQTLRLTHIITQAHSPWWAGTVLITRVSCPVRLPALYTTRGRVRLLLNERKRKKV